MELRHHESLSSERIGHKLAYNLFFPFLLAGFVIISSATALHGQNTPPPPAAPEVEPEPPEPPEVPEPPEPPEPRVRDRVYIFNDGSVHLGVTLSDLTVQRALELKLPVVAGAQVDSVLKDSAAARAGLEKGDVILEFDGIRVRSSAELRRLIGETPSGRTVAMKVIRNGKSLSLSAELKASSQFNMPEIQIPPMRFDMPRMYVPPMRFDGLPPSPEAHHATLGIAGDDLTPQLAQYFGVKSGTGVLVSDVTQGGPADHAGLKAGDVIVQVDGKPVRGVEELRSALNDNFNGDTRKVSLTIVRDHRDLNVNVDLVRFHADERHTSSNAVPDRSRQPGDLRTQAQQLRAQAEEFRREAERVRAEVQMDVNRQNEFLNSEWQQELRQEMQTLQREIPRVKEFHFAMNEGGEI